VNRGDSSSIRARDPGARGGPPAPHVIHPSHHLIEQLPIGAVLRAGDRLALNAAAAVLTGYPQDAINTIDAWCTALHGDQATAVRPRYETGRLAGAAGEPAAFAMLRRDGQVRHVQIVTSHLDDTAELWLLTDLTERDRAEAAVRRSDDSLRSIVDMAVDAIITIDSRGTIDRFNPAAQRMFGYTAAEAIGHNVCMLMPSPYREEHDRYLARYHDTGEAHIIGIGREVMGQRKDGTTFPLDLAVSEIDHRHCYTGILHDLTARRRLEWALAESQADERRAVARELHDGVGGSMTGIALLAKTLQKALAGIHSPLGSTADALVTSISAAQAQLRQIVRDVTPVEAVPEGLMHALQDLARRTETQHGVSCLWQCDPPVFVDDASVASHLYRIVQEAVHNAVRHGQPSEITVRLAVSGAFLEMTVTDNGRGLKKVPVGHDGIGLHSLRQRAALLGGLLVVYPRSEGGTVVACRMPWPAKTGKARAAVPGGEA
jgi:PAS domain S-box-containing protein